MPGGHDSLFAQCGRAIRRAEMNYRGMVFGQNFGAGVSKTISLWDSFSLSLTVTTRCRSGSVHPACVRTRGQSRGTGVKPTQDSDVASAVERAWRDEVPAANKRGGDQVSESRRSSATQSVTEKNDADSILARLKRDDPETAQKVINGELTANASPAPAPTSTAPPTPNLQTRPPTGPSPPTTAPHDDTDEPAHQHGQPTRPPTTHADQDSPHAES